MKCSAIPVHFWVIILISSNAHAASASIVASSSTVTVGNKVTVTVKVTAAAWSLNVSGSTNGNIVGYNESGKNKSISKTFTFTPKSTGTYKVSLNGDITDANDKESKIGKSVTVTAKPRVTNVNNNTNTNNSSNNNTTNNNDDNNNNTSTREKSSNANLSILGVKPSKYDFTGYRWSVTEYKVTVPNDVTKLTVYATPASSKARYSVSGNSGFKVGTNIITVKVTAENGNTKKYKIYVTREAKEEETIPNVTDDNTNTNDEEEKEPEEGIGLESLEIEGYNLDKDFDSNIFNYKVEIGEDEISALELKDLIIAKSNYNKAKIYIDIEKGDEGDYFIFDAKVRVADPEKEYASYDIKFVKSLSATASINEDEENIAPEEKEVNKSESVNEKDEDIIFGYERNKVERFAFIAIITVLLVVVIILSIIIGNKNAKLSEYKDREEFLEEENKEVQDSEINEYRNLNSSYSYDTANQETKVEDNNKEMQKEENIEDDNSYKYESIYRSPRRLNSKSGGRHF